MSKNFYVRSDGTATNGGAYESPATFTLGITHAAGGAATFTLVDNAPIYWVVAEHKIHFAAGTLASLSIGADALAGVYVNCLSNVDAIATPGRYKIIGNGAGADDYLTLATDIDPANKGPTAGGSFDIHVGGAIPIATACDLVAAGDTVYMQADATYSVLDAASSIMVPSTAGTVGAYISYIGFTTTPGDGGTATLSNAALNYAMSSVADYLRFANLRITGLVSHGIYGPAADYLNFSNCEFDTNGGRGAQVEYNCRFYSCSFHGNTGYGLYSGHSAALASCSFYDNGDYGIYCVDAVLLYGCLFYGNTNGAIWVNAMDGRLLAVVNCTLDGETVGKGIYLADATPIYTMALFNNIIYDFATGIEAAVDLSQGPYLCGYGNLFNSNTADNTFLPLPADTLTGAPVFTNEAGANYTLQRTSPCVGAAVSLGTGVLDIGAYQRARDYPTVGNVTEDDTVDGQTGTYHEATAAEVSSGVQFGANGTEFTGTATATRTTFSFAARGWLPNGV